MVPQVMNKYILKRLKELGHKISHMRFRHLVLAPAEVRVISGRLQLFILAEAIENLRMKSEMAVFDLQDPAVNELQYEHQGTIVLTNYALNPLHVKLIQLFFKTRKDGRASSKKIQ
jgi:hypothetical protein